MSISTENYQKNEDEDQQQQQLSAPRIKSHKTELKFTKTKSVTFIWGESCCGQRKNGPQTAPALLITEQYLNTIQDLGWTPNIHRCPQIFAPTPNNITTHLYEPFSVAETCDSVCRAVVAAHNKGAFPVLVGGDHCLALGSVLGSMKAFPELRVLWFDAHADINTPETSPSGNIHGMPLAGLLGLMRPIGMDDGRFHCLAPDRLGYIGLRDVDDGEKVTLKSLGIEPVAFTTEDLNEKGIVELTRRVLQQINPNNEFPLHLSFDVDGMDPMDAPATGTPVRMGVRLHEALMMIEIIRETGCLVSMDCVEVNPLLGTESEVSLTVANAQLAMATALANADPVGVTGKK